MHFRRVLFVMAIIGALITGGVPFSSAAAQNAAPGDLYAELTRIKQAEGEDAANAYFATLGAEDQASLSDFVNQVTYTDEVTDSSRDVGTLTAGCWNRTHSRSASSSISGELFWQLNQTVYWCGNGAYVTDLWCSATASTPGFGWGGGITQYCQLVLGGNGYNVWRYQTAASFDACWGNGWCPIGHDPVVYQQGEGSGAYAGWGG